MLIWERSKTPPMQTFLPYRSFTQSAKVLDNKRLGKQRVEAWQILTTLLHLKKHPNAKPARYHHPAVLMWKGHETLLAWYGYIMCEEWKIQRGFKDTLLRKFACAYAEIHDPVEWLNVARLTWLTPAFIKSHRSNLLRKDPKHYRKYWPKLPDNLPYIWPIRITNK